MTSSVIKSIHSILFDFQNVQDAAKRQKAWLLAVFLLAMIGVFALVDLISVLTIPNYAIPWYGYLMLVGAFLLNRRAHYQVAAWITALMFPLVVVAALTDPIQNSGAVLLIYLIPGLIVASLLLSTPGLILLTVIDGLIVMTLAQFFPALLDDVNGSLNVLAALSLCAVLLEIFIQNQRHLSNIDKNRLRLSEQRYRTLFEEAPDGLLIVDYQDKIQMANAAALRLTGYALGELIGRSPSDLILIEEAVPASETFSGDRASLASRNHVAQTLIRKDGSQRAVIVNASLMLNGNGQYLIRDVSDLRRAEAGWRLSEQKFAKAFQSSPDSITISELESGIFIEVNDGFSQMSGYRREEAIGTSGEELGIWNDITDRHRVVELLKTSGRVRNFEAVLRRKAGQPLDCILSAELLRLDDQLFMIMITRDITDQKQMERELRLNEERYRLVSSVISDYTFSNVENETGEIILNWVAGAFEQISGYTVDEFNQRGGWTATLHPDDLEKDGHAMEILRQNKRVVSEVRTIRKDGSVSWVRSYAHPVWDPVQDRLVGIYGAVQDITETKLIELERERLIHELEAKNRELEQFTYTVSHDLKAPLITIKGFLGFLETDYRAGDHQRVATDIQHISQAAEKMHELLTDLLELSRIGRIMNAPQAVSFAELVEQALQMVEGALQKRAVRVVVQTDLPSVYGDRQRLMEVIQNLIDNAIKFMGDQAQPQIEVGAEAKVQEGMATFFVRDNGIGIAPEFHERIFGLFHRLNPQVEGTGIGLALVQRIVEIHGGKVWLESKIGEGSTFYFTLPVPHSFDTY